MELSTKLKALEGCSRANRYADRIFSELMYLYHLNRARNLGWENKLDRAMTYLLDCVRDNGAIIREDCENVETALADLSDEAKSITVHCVAHAHIDMNYQWGYQETVSITTETFRTMLDLMKEYPDFTYSQSQASVYEIVEKYDPAQLAEIKERVKEGRWELAATSWVECDKNMPNGESLCRHISYTKKYLSELFDIDPDTLCLDYEPDTFGHAATVPEILQDGGVDYYYHCRGCNPRGPYRWQSPSGKEVIAYSDPSWYQCGIDYRAFAYYPQIGATFGDGTMDQFLKVYGVGDHGGGPTRIDLEKITDMMTWPLYPTLKFSRYDTYFKYLESFRDTLPVHVGEINFVFAGCYTSQGRIKMANRKAETRLYDAEMLAAQTAALTGKMPQINFTKAWTNTLFNQFHDILPGSCIVDTREDAMGRFQETIGYTNSASIEALRGLSDAIDTEGIPYDDNAMVRSEGSGAGFLNNKDHSFAIAVAERGHGSVRILHLVNTTAYERDETATVLLWDYPADVGNIEAHTHDGTPVPVQILDNGKRHFHNAYATLLMRVKVPAFGYQTVILKQKDVVNPNAFNLPPINGRRQDTFGDQNMVLENEYIRAEFDAQTCTLVSLIDKESNTEMLPAGDRSGGQFRLVHENPRFGHSAWTRGPAQKTEILNEDNRVHVSNYARGGLSHWFTYEMPFGTRSNMSVTVRLNAGSRLIDYDMRINWLETGNNDDQVLLTFSTPAAYNIGAYRYEIANGVIVREEFANDVPSIGRMELLPAEGGHPAYLQIMADTKYGFQGWNQRGELSLLHASFYPDLYPEMTTHHIHAAIAVVRNGEEAQKLGDCYDHELIPVSGKPHKGTLPMMGSMFTVSDIQGISPSSISLAEDGSLILRFYNRTDEMKVTNITLPVDIATACYVDLNENEQAPVMMEGKRTIIFSIDAYATQTIKVTLNKA